MKYIFAEDMDGKVHLVPVDKIILIGPNDGTWDMPRCQEHHLPGRG